MAWYIKRKTNKYSNRKVEIDGRIFDSLKEAGRYQELKLLEMAGKISDLQCQVRFELQPKFKNEETGKTERAITYFADFVYMENGKQVIEDAKGFKTEAYKIKKKMMAYKGYYIKEV